MKPKIKSLLLILIIIFSGFLFKCSTSNGIKVEPVLKNESCTADINNKYVIYIPSHSTDCKEFSMIVILDPHGSGEFAIRKFIDCAENYKCILVASNLVRNNFSGFMQAIELMISDVKSKYPFGDKIYIAGFSGGARMAITYAQGNRVNGVLAFGALANADQIKSLNTKVFAISGISDFNFTEAAPYLLDIDNIPSNLRLEISGEIHQWPEPYDIKRAMGNIILSENFKNNKCIKKNELIKNYSNECKSNVDSLYQAGLLIPARLACQNVLSLNEILHKGYFRDILNSILHDNRFNEELIQLKKSLEFEFKVRDAYYNALRVRDDVWWANEIDDLNKHINETGEIYKKNAYRRIKAFLGIVCYSVTNNALRTGDLNTAQKILKIYKLVEPENPDMYYFSALLDLKTGETDLIKENLEKALREGFTDFSTLKKDFSADYLSGLKLE